MNLKITRQANRLHTHDYSRDGYYYVTICAKDMVCYFGTVKNNAMRLTATGIIAEQCWRAIPAHFPNTTLDEYIIMPNHLHGIIIVGRADMCSTATHPARPNPTDRSKMTLPKIIQAYKSAVTRTARRENPNSAFGWQKSYYDHVIRNDADLSRIREYIRDNPLKWALDAYNQNRVAGE